MGLFDRITGRTGQSDNRNRSKSNNDPINEYSGMRVEVFDEHGTPLFFARISATWSGTLDLIPLTEVMLPEDTISQQIRFRGYSEISKEAIHLEGVITWRDEKVWQLKQFRVTSRANDRAFFRQDISAPGQVTPVGKVDLDSHYCELLNISAGGVCFRVAEEYMAGDKLLITSKLLPNWEVAPLLCVIRRVIKKKSNLFEYGCEFMNLAPATEDQIAKVIMELQRERVKR